MVKLLALFCLASAVFSNPLPPTLFNGMRWRLVGPFRAGRAVAVTGVPNQPNTFYFGGADSGIWKTTDAGIVWEPVFDGQPVGSIGAIAVAPSDPNVLYAGTGESDIRSDLASGNGIYKSVDAGKTWSNIGLHHSWQISRVMVDPAKADHVYVAALGNPYGPNPERGVYESVDGGTTWKKTLYKGPEIGAADLSIAVDQPNVLIAAMWNAHRPPWSTYAPLGGPGSGLYLSKDGGQTWTPVTGHGLPSGDWERSAVAIAPGTHGQRIYALVDAKTAAGLYRSDDEGATWTRVNNDPRLTSRQWYFASLTVDPTNPDIVYLPNVALYRSKDGGKTFSILRGAPGGDDYHQIWISSQDPTRMVLGTDQGTTISVDDGATWSSWYNQPTAQFYHVSTDNASPYWIYGTQQDSGSASIVSRTDHGKITARDWKTASGSESGYIAPDPNNPDILYVSGTYGEVDRYNKRTQLSQNIAPWPMPAFGTDISQRKYRDTWTPVLLFSPFDKKTLYLGTQYVMKTTDGGLHWENISPDLTGASADPQRQETTPPTVENAKERGYGTVFTIAPSSLRADLIWAGTDTGLIQVTTNGKTWKNVTPPGLSDWSRISLIEASHFDPAVAYAAVDRSRLSDTKPYVYRTKDYGKTWSLASKGISGGAFVRAVREDPQQKGLLFAGTELGVYVSFDDGDNWQPLQQNLPVTSVRDLAIHGDDLIAATHGRSFWVLDNITPLRQAGTMNTENASLYKPAVAMRIDNNVFPGTPLPPEEPTAENPPSGIYIDYFLPSTTTDVMKLELLDASQKVIRYFSSEQKEHREHKPLPIAERWFPEPQHLANTAGMHRFIWDLRAGSAATPGDEEQAFEMNPAGPKVSPGEYQVRLTANGKTMTQPLKVVMDPNSPATTPVLSHQFTLSQKLFDDTLRSRQAMAEINSVQAQLTQTRQALGNEHADAAKSIDAMLKQIDEVLQGKHDDGLMKANTGLNVALRVIEEGDRTPPSQAMEIYTQSSAAATAQTANWKRLKTGALTQLNNRLQQQNLKTVQISEIETEVYQLMTR